jgi:hypothetical protein
MIGTKSQFRQQIANASARGRYDVANEVRKILKSNESVRQSAVRLVETAPGDLSIVRKDLKKIVDSGASVDAVNKLRRRITQGVKGLPLRAAYRDVLKSLEDGNEEKIAKQMEYAIEGKARYNAERVVRTERERARAQADREAIARDEDVKFVKFVLALGHDPDECDAYANADLGWGPGIYPLDQAPVLPIHPNGKSRLVPVYVPPKEPKPGKEKGAVEALEETATKRDVKLYNVQFSPITRQL